MAEMKTAAYRHAKALAVCLRQKQRLAFNLETDGHPEIVSVHSEAIWNDRDSKALEEWDNYDSECQGLTKLNF